MQHGGWPPVRYARRARRASILVAKVTGLSVFGSRSRTGRESYRSSILTDLPYLECHVSKIHHMYGAIGKILASLPSLHDPSPVRAMILPASQHIHLPRHQAQVNSPDHPKKTGHQQSLVHWDNSEVENRHKGPKLKAGDHDRPKFLMTPDISYRW